MRSITALQHVYSSFTASAVNQNGKPGAPGSCKEDDCTNNSVLREGDLQQNRNYGGDKNSGKSSDQCLHDSENAVNKKRSPPGATQKKNPAPPARPASYSTCSKPAESSPDPDPPAVNKDRVRPIRARDYKKLEIPEPKTPCHSCGKKGSWYVEKFTAERRARPKGRAGSPADLPHVLQRGGKSGADGIGPAARGRGGFPVRRVTADIGKCSVCGIAKAVWLDRETGVKLCEHCYGRGGDGRMQRRRGWFDRPTSIALP